jgi:chondroitin AC lyase
MSLLSSALILASLFSPAVARDRAPIVAEAKVTTNQESLDQVRWQFISWHTGAEADRNAPRMREALQWLEGTTSWVISPEHFLSNGSWSDIDYSGDPSGSWGPWDHTRRLLVMVKAYHTPGQSFHRDPLLRAQIERVMQSTLTFYGITALPRGNWWFWTIGIPMDLGPSLVMMEGEIDQRVFDDLVLSMKLKIGSSPTSRGISGPIPTGQNLVWTSWTHLCLGLIENDASRLAAVRDAMSSLLRAGVGEGIQSDSSFHQHGAQLYTGGYGGTFANDVARYALMTEGTSFELAGDALESLTAYIADGVAWSLNGRYFDVSVISREVARPTTSGYNGLAALLQVSAVESSRSNEIRAAARKMLASWTDVLPSELAALAAKIEQEPIAAAWPAGHRHYFASDYTVHRRPGWFASIKMFSKRTKSGESTNDENLLGSRQSDGRFHLTLEGDEFQRDIWPAFDWSRMPGTTVELKPNAANHDYGYGSNTLAGGTGDGMLGVAAMELMPRGSSLTARKSWFFFDDSIVFLTNGIRATSEHAVETIAAQWPAASAYSRNDWAVLGSVGYWFPAQSPSITTTTRTGSWAALGGSSDTTPHTKTLTTIAFDHGRTPVDASAEYVVVPGAGPSSMSSWVASRPLTILANDSFASAVRDNRTGALGIVFWKPGEVEGIAARSAATVLVREDGSRLRLSVADPNCGWIGAIEIVVPGLWTTSSAPYRREGNSTVVAVPRRQGRTTGIVLEPMRSRRRAVR